ncbi:Seryl-tRNA synthetase N-terminal domain-containing protein [Ochromonadaceae sp. CCMP2298]|nr:Seryl-tRNA synthetase N-terminal domain-containing protein [Ochromonadaceae sp. CCMP2298]
MLWRLLCVLMISVSAVPLRHLSRSHTLRSSLRSTLRLYSSREPSNLLSLDTQLISSQPDLVVGHLRSRKADEALIERVLRIKALRTERNSCIVEGDAAKGVRKALSKDIGLLMRDQKMQEAEELKKRVELASADSAAADEKLAVIDSEIDSILSLVPNLLDDAVPEGRDEADNQVVGVWGEERRKLGQGFLWHDEVARNLNGIDIDAAARISGARFSVLVGPVARLVGVNELHKRAVCLFICLFIMISLPKSGLFTLFTYNRCGSFC